MNRRSVAVVCVSVLVLAAGALVGIHLFRSDVELNEPSPETPENREAPPQKEDQ